MARARYTRQTSMAVFVDDHELITLLNKYGIFTVGGLLETPLGRFIKIKELFKSYDKISDTIMSVQRLVSFDNFTL